MKVLATLWGLVHRRLAQQSSCQNSFLKWTVAALSMDCYSRPTQTSITSLCFFSILRRFVFASTWDGLSVAVYRRRKDNTLEASQVVKSIKQTLFEWPFALVSKRVLLHVKM